MSNEIDEIHTRNLKVQPFGKFMSLELPLFNYFLIKLFFNDSVYDFIKFP